MAENYFVGPNARSDIQYMKKVKRGVNQHWANNTNCHIYH